MKTPQNNSKKIIKSKRDNNRNIINISSSLDLNKFNQILLVLKFIEQLNIQPNTIEEIFKYIDNEQELINSKIRKYNNLKDQLSEQIDKNNDISLLYKKYVEENTRKKEEQFPFLIDQNKKLDRNKKIAQNDI